MVTVADMRSKLITVDEARERLSRTEPLSKVTFPLRGGNVQWRLEEGWNNGLDNVSGTDLIGAWLRLGDVEYHLTKDAALEGTSLIGLTKQYVSKTPHYLIEPHLNYWYANRDSELGILARETDGLALTKASIDPFSNIRLVDEAL